MPRKVLVDTGYWIALFNERDEHHALAQVLEGDLSVDTLLVPWPTLFECVDTRLARRRSRAIRFKQFLSRETVALIDDTPYRYASLDYVLDDVSHDYSLTDHVIRSMLEDVNLFVDAFVGFNPKDFYDVCATRRIEMLYRD